MRLLFKINITLLVLAGLLILFASYLAHSLGSPKRRPLMDYHLSWVNAPERHGLSLKSFTTSNGTPVIIVEPHGQPAKRGIKLRSQVNSPQPFGTIHANLILLHGRKGRKEDLLPVAERFCAVGFRCILLDLPAHGESPIEKNSFATSDLESKYVSSAYLELAENYGWSNLPAHLCGMSMGGAFVNKTLSTSPELWDRGIIICSFDHLENVIDRQLLKPMIKPLLYSLSHFNIQNSAPADWAKSIPHPVLVAHGTDDDLITLEQGKNLFSSYPNPSKKFTTAKGAHHQNILITAHPLYKEMTEFLLQP